MFVMLKLVKLLCPFLPPGLVSCIWGSDIEEMKLNVCAVVLCLGDILQSRNQLRNKDNQNQRKELEMTG